MLFLGYFIFSCKFPLLLLRYCEIGRLPLSFLLLFILSFDISTLIAYRNFFYEIPLFAFCLSNEPLFNEFSYFFFIILLSFNKVSFEYSQI
jgi:hypothetical protein